MDRGNAFGRNATGNIHVLCDRVHESQQPKTKCLCNLENVKRFVIAFRSHSPFFFERSLTLPILCTLENHTVHSFHFDTAISLSHKQISILMMLPNICSTPFINIT